MATSSFDVSGQSQVHTLGIERRSLEVNRITQNPVEETLPAWPRIYAYDFREGGLFKGILPSVALDKAKTADVTNNPIKKNSTPRALGLLSFNWI